MSASICKPDCPVCGGVGWIRNDVPVDHPDFGKLRPCPNADVTIMPRYKESGLTNDEFNMSWSGVWDIGIAAKVAEILKKVLSTGYGFVFMYGGYGLGKTHMLKTSVSEYLRKKDKTAVYANASSIIEALRSVFDDNATSSHISSLRYWSEVDLLCIDEFDKVRDTPFAQEQRFMLLDTRYVMAVRQKGITFIASNEPPEFFSPYIHDRLRDGRCSIVRMDGPSVRPGMDYD